MGSSEMRNFLKLSGIEGSANWAISNSFKVISKETDGLFRLSFRPCCQTKIVITREIY